jgi:hypothetical protein
MDTNDTIQDRKINAAMVADIWNERAKKRGVQSHYTRFSVRSRRAELAGERTPIGWLYSEQKAHEIPLRPRSTGRPDRAEANKTPFKRRV